MDNPGIRPKQICEKLDLSHAPSYLTPLIKLGILTKKKEKSATRYFVDETKAREAELLI